MFGGFTFEKEEWCDKFWHKFYKHTTKIKKFKNGEVVEIFCGKCGKKTDGYTHFHIGTFELTPTPTGGNKE